MEGIPGETAGFFNAEVMRQFCSSPVQVADLFSKLVQSGGFKKMRFVRQNDLTHFVENSIGKVQRCVDNKFERLLEIIQTATGQKAVVVCQYIEKAKKFAAGIK